MTDKQQMTQERTMKYRWKPGQSGNPKGRPRKSLCIPDILNMISNENAPAIVFSFVGKIYPGIKNMTMREALMRMVYIKAITGKPNVDISAVNFIADRTEGKVRELDTEQRQIDLSELADAIRTSSMKREQ